MILFLLVCLTGADALETEDSARVDIILYELDDLRRHPININDADAEELCRLPFLDQGLTEAIVRYRRRAGGLRDPDDLRRVPGITLALMEQIRPYIRTSVRAVSPRPVTQRIQLRADPARSGTNELYTATKVNNGDLRAALITEKDPRESSYLDYWAAGLVTQYDQRSFALGRYDLDLGAGTMLSSMGSFFSTLDFRMISRERGIKPYTSTLENGGFFGAAFSDSIPLRYTFFYSNLDRDGRIDDDGNARSFDDSGDHADSAGLARQDRINEDLAGYHIQHRIGGLKIGHSAYTGAYRPAFACGDSAYDFYGRRFWMTGVDMRYGVPGFLVFSELARSHRDRIGGIFGFSAARPPLFFQVAGKYFPRGFFSPKGGEALDGHSITTITARYRSRIVLLGSEMIARRDLRDDSTRYDVTIWGEKEAGMVDGKILLRWRWNDSRSALTGSRATIRITPWRLLYAEARLEDKADPLPDPVGRGFFGGLEIGVVGQWFGFKTRLGWFDVDDYACRIIAYEPDLPGVVNNRVLYNQGRYGFILGTIKPVAWGELSVKYAVMDRDSLTGQIGGQVDVKW